MKKGFTLIELIVVMAIFMFIIGAAVGIFISVVERQRKVLSDEQLLNQISYAQEYISKALRMAETEEAGDGCNGAGYIYNLTKYNSDLGHYEGIKFINRNQTDSNLACQEFYLDTSSGTPPYILYEKRGASGTPVRLTSKNLYITSMSFAIDGVIDCDNPASCSSSGGDGKQPRVTILFNIKDSSGTNKAIQITISRRNINTGY